MLSAMDHCRLLGTCWARSRTKPFCRCLFITICLTLLIAGSACRAQSIALRHFGQADGLASLSVASLFLDRSGYIWAGTESGVFRYNGLGFERQGHAADVGSAVVRAIDQSSAAGAPMFIGTGTELYVGDAQGFTPVRAGTRALPIGVGASLAAFADGRMLALSGGEVWLLQRDAAGTWRGDAALTHAELASLPPGAPLGGVYITPGGTVWLICGESLCERLPRGILVWGAERGVPADDWRSLLVDPTGSLWVRGTDHLIRLDPGAKAFVAQDPPHAAITSSYHFVPLSVDRDGRLLTRTNNGLARFDGHVWQEFTAANGLSKLAVRNLLRDNQGSIWMSNSGRGVSRWLAYDRIESWTSEQGLLGEAVWQIIRDRDRLLVNTSGGCNALTAATAMAVSCGFDGLPPGQITQMVASDAGNVWLNYPHALFHVPPGEHLAQSVPDLVGANLLYVDHHSQLWLCYSDHLLVVPADGELRSAPRRINYPDGAMTVTGLIAGNAEDIWVATLHGLYKLSKGVWNKMALSLPAGITLQDLALDGSTLWLAGYPHGLLRADVSDGRISGATWQGSPILNGSALMFVRVDARHRVWVGTELGIAMFDGVFWRRLSQSDGLVWNDIDEDSFLADQDGSVWIGTGNGLSHLKAPDALFAARSLIPSVSRALLGTTSLKVGENPIEISWSADRSLMAQLALLDFDLSPSTLFRVRLVGNDGAWFETQDSQLHVATLQPGAYDLQVAAVDSEQHLDSPILNLPFYLGAPWWEQRWFRAVEFLAVAGMLTVFMRLWVRKIALQRHRAEQQLEEHRVLLHRATRDSLTGLWNRGAIMDILERAVVQAAAEGQTLAVVIIDLDHFKRINDTYGHAVGDAVLRIIGPYLEQQVRSIDSIGRYGGEELLIVMPGLQEAYPATVIERLRASFAKLQIPAYPDELHVTASFGVAWLRGEADTASLLLDRADQALYEAKRAGRDQVIYAPLRAA
jgi:diguanylate cyclase (GGDEF)-like protein